MQRGFISDKLKKLGDKGETFEEAKRLPHAYELDRPKGFIKRVTNIIIDNLQGKIITRKRDEVDILTPQEKKVLILLASGFKNAEIAQKLFISEKTVKTHIHKIFKKIKVSNRLQAALWASKNLTQT